MNIIIKIFICAICLTASSSFAISTSCYQRINNTLDKLQECITIEGLVSHLRHFQIHADNNRIAPGTRFIGTSGFNDSRDYIIKHMTEAGYKVTVQNIPVDISYVTTPRVFEQKFPVRTIYEDNRDYTPFINSGMGDVTANVQIPSGNMSGCSANDFIGFNPGNIALVEYNGTCPLQEKVSHAVTAGAPAVIISNSTMGIYFSALAASTPFKNIPVVFVSQHIGIELQKQAHTGFLPIVHIKFDTIKISSSQNIIAESQTGNPNHIVMAGAHLDSASGNAGMNDNASAAATMLETALLMKNTKPVNKLRFVWWTGEEEGLLGSAYYVNHLDDQDRAKISLYLDHKILGASNGGRMIMGTAFGITSRGSEKVTKMYSDYFETKHLKAYVFDPTFSNVVARSDMYPFIKANIPVGYLATDTDILWDTLFTTFFTDLSKRIEGLRMHPCYHRLCDKLTTMDGEPKDINFDFNLYLQMSKAAAYAIYTYAMDLNR